MTEWITGLSEVGLGFVLALVMMGGLLAIGGLVEGRRARLAAERKERERFGLPPEEKGR